jgi:hypothetical protein
MLSCAENERKYKSGDVRSVYIGIGHNNELMITKF